MKKIAEFDNDVKIKRINFHNPITDASDHIIIPEEVLERMWGASRNGMIQVSFFYAEKEMNYLLILHIDRDNKVRSVYSTNFFLYSEKKLFSAPTDGDFNN